MSATEAASPREEALGKSQAVQVSGQSNEIIRALFNQMNDLGGTDKDMRFLLRDPDLRRKVVWEILDKKVKVSKPLPVELRAGRQQQQPVEDEFLPFDWHGATFLHSFPIRPDKSDLQHERNWFQNQLWKDWRTPEGGAFKFYPLGESQSGRTARKVVVVDPHRWIRYEEVLELLDQHGLLPAAFPELLDACRQHPKLRANDGIVALGSQCEGRDGRLFGARCYNEGERPAKGERRYSSLKFWPTPLDTDGWTPNTRFLALLK